MPHMNSTATCTTRSRQAIPLPLIIRRQVLLARFVPNLSWSTAKHPLSLRLGRRRTRLELLRGVKECSTGLPLADGGRRRGGGELLVAACGTLVSNMMGREGFVVV
jgi:hypothetical protein